MKKNTFFLLFLGLFLISCESDVMTSALKGMGIHRSKVWIEKISFKASENMNDQAPVTVDLLIIYDKDLLADIVKMSASEYFEQADQMKIDNAGKMDVFSWDITRGQRLLNQDVSMSQTAGEGAIIFARYSTDGPHRAVLEEQKSITVKLDDDDFSISEDKES